MTSNRGFIEGLGERRSKSMEYDFILFGILQSMVLQKKILWLVVEKQCNYAVEKLLSNKT